MAGGFFEIVEGDNDLPDTKNEQTTAASVPSESVNVAPAAAAPAVETPDNSGTDEEDELDGMTVSELRGYAEINGINLGRLTKKADIIEAIRKAEA